MKQKVFMFIEIFLMTWALIRVSNFSTGNIFGLLFLGLAIGIYKFSESQYDNKAVKHVSTSLGVIFSILIVLGSKETIKGDLSSVLFSSLILLFVLAGLFFLFRRCLIILYSLMIRFFRFDEKIHTKKWAIFYEKHIFIISAVFTFICFIPYFLYLYPGVLTPDSINQLGQAIGEMPYENANPLVNTLIIKLWVQLGLSLTGSLSVAVSFYILFQMAMVALTAGYAIRTMQIYNLPLWSYLVTLGFYALVPYNAVMAVTMWKDVLFAVAVLVFICTMLRLIKEFKISYIVIFGIFGLAICLFRSNGWYGFLLAIPFLFYYYRKNMLPVYPVLVGIVLLAIIVKGPVMNAFNVTQPDFVESVSVPSQMIARVVVNGSSITQKEQEMIDKVVDSSYIKELYVESFADNMKELMRAGHPEYLEEHKADYLKLFITLGFKHPLDYLDAYIGQTRGYWYPDSYYTIADAEGISKNSFGLEPNPLIRGKLIVKAKEIFLKLGNMIPLYGIIWSLGSITWIILISLGASLVRKNRCWIAYIPGLAILATVLIATPVAADFRYMYFNAFALPILFFINLQGTKEK